MRSAMIGGGATALGLFLAIWAVYQQVRLDWPETALLAGVTLLVVGMLKLAEITKEMLCGDEDDY